MQAMQAMLRVMDRVSCHAVSQLHPQGLFVQGNGVLQGGAVTAVLDCAMAFATRPSGRPRAIAPPRI